MPLPIFVYIKWVNFLRFENDSLADIGADVQINFSSSLNRLNMAFKMGHSRPLVHYNWLEKVVRNDGIL